MAARGIRIVVRFSAEEVALLGRAADAVQADRPGSAENRSAVVRTGAIRYARWLLAQQACQTPGDPGVQKEKEE